MANLQLKHIGELPGTPPERTLLVATDQDYCLLVAELRRDLAAAYDAIWIRQHHHFAWLRAFVEHAGLGHLRPTDFSQTTARDLLAAHWGLAIPSWLTDELILAENLLDRPVPPGPHEHAVAVLLSPLLPPASLLSSSFPRAHAGLLAEKASALAFQTGLAASAVTRAAWQNTLQAWAAAGTPGWVADFCTRLRSDPAKLWRDLTVWRLLQRYPAAQLEFALDPSAVAFVRKVPPEAFKDMNPQPDGRVLALDQIQPLCEQLLATPASRTKFASLLNAVSGELPQEFNGLDTMLSRAAFKVERTDVEGVVRRFKSCAEIGTAALTRLQLYVRPPEPAAVDAATADAAVWTRWFQEQYLYFRSWQVARQEASAPVETSVGDFSEWYCREFVHVHADPNLSAVQALTQWRTSILADSISLVLMVDNLPWSFWPAFEKALADAGLHRHECHSRIAPLPSLTSISKPAIVSGRWDVTGSDYRKMLETRSAEEWSGRPVHYLSGVDQLAAHKDFSAPVVLLLNYLAGDEALHSDAAAEGTTHADKLALLYQSLGQRVGEFARRAGGQGRKFGLYVLTDHGATSVLPSETRSIDAQLTKRLFPNEKYRSATLSVTEAAAIPENLWELGFRFVNPCHAGDSVHFIPRGHNTVASLARQTFCHGGATPEEVIVPTAVFRLFPANWIAPAVRFLLKLKDGRAAFYVKRMATVEIEIQNPNAAELKLESVSLTPLVGEIRSFSQATIAANSLGQASVSLYFAPAATIILRLTFEFQFRVAQETLTRQIELPVVISSAASTGTDLTNLFS